jgi:hypothetical protein
MTNFCTSKGEKMSTQKKLLQILFVLVFILSGCGGTGGADESLVRTQVALEAQQTAILVELTVPVQPPAAQATQPPPVTATQAPPEVTSPPLATATEEILPTATQDIKERMKSAKILVYEDTPDIGLWIKSALSAMGLKSTFVGDAMGHFLTNLNSDTEWDLIILGAEAHSAISGEFFDVITKRVVEDNTAFIAEVWYLDTVGEGRIKPLTTQCGIELQANYDTASSIYWLDSEHPIFNEPNTAIPLMDFTQYWPEQSGDLIRLIPGSKAILLAGMRQDRNNDYGVIASCFDGRVIFQTFSNHDYNQKDIQVLWQNYIYNTLKSRFAVAP